MRVGKIAVGRNRTAYQQGALTASGKKRTTKTAWTKPSGTTYAALLTSNMRADAMCCSGCARGAKGLPSEECVLNPRGIVVTCDPSNPNFERCLRESIDEILSPDGYNADGLKIDFTERSPSGPNLYAYGEAWSLS